MGHTWLCTTRERGLGASETAEHLCGEVFLTLRTYKAITFNDMKASCQVSCHNIYL